MYFDEAVLHDVGGVLLVLDHAKSDRVGPPVVAIEEDAKGSLVSLLDTSDELSVLVRVLGSLRRGRAGFIHALDRLIRGGGVISRGRLHPGICSTRWLARFRWFSRRGCSR